MHHRLSGLVCGGIIFTTALLALLFPPQFTSSHGGEKDKDAVIERLQKQIEAQQKEIQFLNEVRKLQAKELEVREQLHKELDAAVKKSLRELEAQQKLAVEQNKKTFERFAAELQMLNKTIADREALVIKLEADNKVLAVKALNFEALATARQIQNENLLELMRDLMRKVALLERGEKPGPAPARDPAAPNSPNVRVEGRIEKIDDKDSSLVQITLGTDHGVNKNHTLDVYRTKPEPKYLGMIRILEAYHQKSVAQFVRVGGKEPNLRVDDLVTSKTAGGAEPKKNDAAPNDPEAPNPPGVNIDGRIVKVDPKDSTLVQISLGSDHGLQKNHTLDAYRLQPRPQYLGIIRIMTVGPQTSFGRLITVGNAAARPMLKEGDLVTSKLTR